jgi:arylsulfatase A-like enzyme
MVKDRSNPGGMTAIVDGRWKLINDHGELQLFDVQSDRDERTDLAATRHDIVDRLRALLAARVRLGKQSPFEH